MKTTIKISIICLICFKSNAQEVTKECYENGQLKSMGSYDADGKELDDWKYYDESGQLDKTMNYN